MRLRPLCGLKATLAKGEPMQPEITIHDHPWGSGKTTAMIENLQEDRKYLVILPLLGVIEKPLEQPKTIEDDFNAHYGSPADAVIIRLA